MLKDIIQVYFQQKVSMNFAHSVKILMYFESVHILCPTPKSLSHQYFIQNSVKNPKIGFKNLLVEK